MNLPPDAIADSISHRAAHFGRADKMEEECGVFGVFSPGDDVARMTCFGLQALQHRGQESAGIAVGDGRTVTVAKDLGLVTQVFNDSMLAALPGRVAVGHVRYSTSGSKATWEAAQPHMSAIGDELFALAHNGTLTNTDVMRAHLVREGVQLFSSTDSEVAAKAIGLVTEMTHHLRDGIAAAMNLMKGAYAMVLCTADALYAFRDPLGIRPLCLGRLPGGGWVVSSETCGLDIVGATYVRDVNPGEIVRITCEATGGEGEGGAPAANPNGNPANPNGDEYFACSANYTSTACEQPPACDPFPTSAHDSAPAAPANAGGAGTFPTLPVPQIDSRQAVPCTGRASCIFEYVYFARPDSVIDGQSVYKARRACGRILARENPARADLVLGVPDSGVPAALGFAAESGIKYCDGIVKNRYVGRTFIQPTQEMRQMGIRLKLNPLPDVIAGKSLVVIDDSIVRGNTSRQLVQMLRDAGATEVHLRITSPEVMWPCYYGIDTDTREQLLAANMTLDGMREWIGCDTLAFMSIEGLHEAVSSARHPGFCDACFTGNYPVEPPTN